MAGLPPIASRRDFMRTASGAALAVAASGVPRPSQAAAGKRRYAIVGTGHRASGMWGKQLLARHPDAVEVVGLCDINPLRAEAARELIGVSCLTFTSFEKMCDETRPELLMVTTVDAEHARYIVAALERGIQVITEKPMIVDEVQCQAVLDAEKRTGRRIVVAFNYRYSPKHRKVKELLASGAIGRVTSVDFSWYLDVYHGADYFRRWHRLRAKGGTLFVHKATHHFDLMNWWLDADPVQVFASGDLKRYGARGAFRFASTVRISRPSRCSAHPSPTKTARRASHCRPRSTRGSGRSLSAWRPTRTHVGGSPPPCATCTQATPTRSAPARSARQTRSPSSCSRRRPPIASTSRARPSSSFAFRGCRPASSRA